MTVFLSYLTVIIAATVLAIGAGLLLAPAGLRRLEVALSRDIAGLEVPVRVPAVHTVTELRRRRIVDLALWDRQARRHPRLAGALLDEAAAQQDERRDLGTLAAMKQDTVRCTQRRVRFQRSAPCHRAT